MPLEATGAFGFDFNLYECPDLSTHAGNKLINGMIMGLSMRALKPDSLDPNPKSRFNVVSRELHTPQTLPALHYWTGSHTLSEAA